MQKATVYNSRMGNAGSTNIRHKSSDLSTPNSPFRELPLREGGGGVAQASGQAFIFDKKRDSVLHGGSSQEDDETTSEPYYTKAAVGVVQNIAGDFSATSTRKRSQTISEGNTATIGHMSIQKDINKDESKRNDIAIETDDEKLNSHSPALPTVLRWDGGGKNVMISGTFTKWKPIPMVRSHGNFVTIIDLPEGDHQYKFCVDGEWKHDPKLKSVENEDGDTTNLVSVRQSDFEVFQALAKDSEQASNHAEKEYSQDVPQIKPWEKVSGPPILPPHLLQVILNKDTPLSCEPTLLPEPNHVMLNHLYALSIKDGVMVLSATHRYRKKYVTTLLYKPI